MSHRSSGDIEVAVMFDDGDRSPVLAELALIETGLPDLLKLVLADLASEQEE